MMESKEMHGNCGRTQRRIMAYLSDIVASHMKVFFDLNEHTKGPSSIETLEKHILGGFIYLLLFIRFIYMPLLI